MCASPGSDVSCSRSRRKLTTSLGLARRTDGIAQANGLTYPTDADGPDPFFALPSLEKPPTMGAHDRSPPPPAAPPAAAARPVSLARLIARPPDRDLRSTSAARRIAASSRSPRPAPQTEPPPLRRLEPPRRTPAGCTIAAGSSDRASCTAADLSVSTPAEYPPRNASTLRRHHRDSGADDTSRKPPSSSSDAAWAPQTAPSTAPPSAPPSAPPPARHAGWVFRVAALLSRSSSSSSPSSSKEASDAVSFSSFLLRRSFIRTSSSCSRARAGRTRSRAPPATGRVVHSRSSPDHARRFAGEILPTAAPFTRDRTSRVLGLGENESSRPDSTSVSVSRASALSHPSGPTPRTFAGAAAASSSSPATESPLRRLVPAGDW